MAPLQHEEGALSFDQEEEKDGKKNKQTKINIIVNKKTKPSVSTIN